MAIPTVDDVDNIVVNEHNLKTLLRDIIENLGVTITAADLAALGGIVLPRLMQQDYIIPDNGSAVVVGEVDLNSHSITLGTNAAIGIII